MWQVVQAQMAAIADLPRVLQVAQRAGTERGAHTHTRTRARTHTRAHAHTRTRAQLLSGLWHGSAYRVTAVWAHTSFDVCPENDQQEPPAPLDGSRGNQTPEGGRQAGTALRQRYGTHHSQTYTPTLPAQHFSCVVCRVVYVCRVVSLVVSWYGDRLVDGPGIEVQEVRRRVAAALVRAARQARRRRRPRQRGRERL
jgi:hypothetical protein